MAIRFNPFKALKAERSKAPPKPKELTLRNLGLEELLCKAIREHARVQIRYKDDVALKIFEPHTVYWNSSHKVCVSGIQITNPQRPIDSSDVQSFEVGKITALSITNQKFVPDIMLDRLDKEDTHGLICSA